MRPHQKSILPAASGKPVTNRAHLEIVNWAVVDRGDSQRADQQRIDVELQNAVVVCSDDKICPRLRRAVCNSDYLIGGRVLADGVLDANRHGIRD